MKPARMAFIALGSWGLLFFGGCEKVEESVEEVKVERGVEVETRKSITRIATLYTQRELEWNDQLHRDGRSKLFNGPIPLPDEHHYYSAAIEDRHFAVFLLRFGKRWKGNVLDSSENIHVFEGLSKDDCLCAIEGEFSFGDALKPSLSCAFP